MEKGKDFLGTPCLVVSGSTAGLPRECWAVHIIDIFIFAWSRALYHYPATKAWTLRCPDLGPERRVQAPRCS